MSDRASARAPGSTQARAEIERLALLLHERQSFWRMLVDGVDVGIVTTDAVGRVTFANRRAQEILGRSRSLLGEDVRSLLGMQGRTDLLVARAPERRWAHAFRAGDREIEIDLTVRSSDAKANDIGFFFVFRDRTAERQLEVERRRFEHLAAMGTMVAGFAHEVRNPMASLRSLAEALQEELAEAHLVLPHVDRMLSVLERVERLVRTSLLFGRPAPPRRLACRPWGLLQSAVSSLHPRMRALGGELSIDAEPDLPDVFVDEGQIVQALVVLLNNALDATSVPARVQLRAGIARPPGDPRAKASEAPPAFVRLEVSDDGPGIRHDLLGRIFDPFFTTKASGTGLGLSIAQQLVTENGGRIDVVSVVGGPTTFGVVVPVALPDAGAPTSR